MKEQKRNKKKKKVLRKKIHRSIGVRQKYRKKGDGRFTSGTMKLMAISSRGEGENEDFEDCWGRSLLDLLEFLGNDAARKVDLRL